MEFDNIHPYDYSQLSASECLFYWDIHNTFKVSSGPNMLEFKFKTYFLLQNLKKYLSFL